MFRKDILLVASLFALLTASQPARAIEMTWEYSVQASATVQASPATITLSWPQDQYMTPNSYTVYRKSPSDTSWGSGVTLAGTATSYTDNSVAVGTAYEYQIVKVTPLYTGYGYVYAGINLPMIDSRGKLVLVVENTYAASLAPELARLQQDLIGDGWSVTRLDVNRNDAVTGVKAQIKAQYAADPANVKCVFLFGHVPVPYSGDIVPDGHIPNHLGAWPCDGYYGDMDGVWTDNSVNDTGADYARNRNVPGDGKFDQSTFPAAIKLMVGRVDLANMPGSAYYGGPPTFPAEQELLRNYLNKDHRFRTRQFDLPRRGVVGDFFGTRNGEAFAASGWRNFSTFFGANNVVNTPDMNTWTPALHTTPYLCAYGAGGGSFTSIGGLGSSGPYSTLLTGELYANDIQAVFTLLFGSWLGDWDSEDNIMRAVLASPTYGLTCAWSGRPHWYLQHMALGEPIGFGARLTQNNGPGGLYQNQINSAAGQIHVALMGDPTLRLHMVAPPASVTAVTNGGSIALNWAASTDSVLGYHVYRLAAANGSYTRLTTSPVTGTSYTDNGAAGAVNYMVRAVKLETSGGGTYYNPSTAAFLNSTGNGVGIGGGGGGGGGGGTNTTSTATNLVVWVDDALPTGAMTGADGGDSWDWTSANPAPFSGTVANQSASANGQHQHYFYRASQTLAVNAGDVLYTYAYLDPANPPSEVMLQWNDGTWEHRAYWGANNINYGYAGTSSRVYMGPLPAAGQWVVLQVPASQVALAGSTLNGMALTLYGGRAVWDKAGKASGTITNSTGGGGGGTNTNTTGGNTLSNMVSWIDDSLPAGAQPAADGGDSWNWVTSSPAPISGAAANQSASAAGLHQHYFTSATQTLLVNPGDTLYAWIFLDPINIPSEIMLQWNDGTWDHRAYWGVDNIGYGYPGTTSRSYMGPVPAAGQWVLLQVPASRVALEGRTLNGMAFSLYGGRATFDKSGKASTTITGGGGGGSTNSTTLSNSVVWVQDTLPSGASTGADGGDTWNWVGSNPTPNAGTLGHQSATAAGLHQHYFYSANQTLTVNVGDSLYTYVYLDPANPPTELMLQWNDGSWDHRAYWGANNISYGSSGASRAYMGPLPAAGQWVLLRVPASQVGLEGRTLNGMAFSLYGGRATWNNAGKTLP